MENMRFWTPIIFLLLASLLAISAEQCGRQAGGALCPNGLCCSQYGYCGTTPEYCQNNCQSQCSGGGGGVGSIISYSLFDQMLKYRNDGRCPSNGFYTYNAFIAAAGSFDGFGTTGDDATRKRELAAFLGQTSHETTDGPYAWGYCFISEIGNPDGYCVPGEWPCAPGKKYYGRGPIQLS
ncbi:Acidic mammalian chitinase [Sarracenia purpurea var. burkii]